MCTIFRDNTMPFIKNETSLRSCCLYVPWSLADSSLTLIIQGDSGGIVNILGGVSMDYSSK